MSDVDKFWTLVCLVGLCVVVAAVVIAAGKPSKSNFTDVGGCKPSPPKFKRGYEPYPNMYNIAKIPALALGANSTMVVSNVGSCASNINGVNRLINGSNGMCTRGSNNFFN
jgi:hypothetical protein